MFIITYVYVIVVTSGAIPFFFATSVVHAIKYNTVNRHRLVSPPIAIVTSNIISDPSCVLFMFLDWLLWYYAVLMSGVEVLPIGAIAGAASQVAWFLPVLVAAVAYFHYEVNDPESRIIDQPGDLILDQYDFIIVGAGSAGENYIWFYYNIRAKSCWCTSVIVFFFLRYHDNNYFKMENVLRWYMYIKTLILLRCGAG